MADMDFRQQLLEAHSENHFMELIVGHTQALANDDTNGPLNGTAIELEQEPLVRIRVNSYG